MDFNIIKSNLNTYQSENSPENIGQQLKIIVENHGKSIYQNIEQLFDEIELSDINSVAKMQLCLIICSSNIVDFILNAENELNLIDINNIISDIIDKTSLKNTIVIQLVVDIFYSVGLNFAFVIGPILHNNEISTQLHAMMPTDMINKDLQKIEDLIENDESSAELMILLEKLCNSGVSKAFYYLGRFYLNGEHNTIKNPEKAEKFLKIAADQGVTEASGLLGNYYYNSPNPLICDFTTAHHYFTKPGSAALDEKQQSAVSDIYEQFELNKILIIFGSFLAIFMLIFIGFFHSGIFSETGRLIIGGITLFFVFLTLIGGFLYFFIKKFNNLRWFIALMYIIWSIYVIILMFS